MERIGMSRAASTEDDGKLRLDKWLWAARFFKTRQLAHEALELGRVKVGGERVKASRVVKIGDELQIRAEQGDFQVTVLALASMRRPAKEAQLLYQESEASRLAREERLALGKAERASFPFGEGKPTKKGRRDILRVKHQG
jgi:ribosome-associated heat shock protein Hsp15